jgi:diguanylate cyclase (GGDEF)-like protein/putative nucleotidyltransferase with HDIG domain
MMGTEVGATPAARSSAVENAMAVATRSTASLDARTARNLTKTILLSAGILVVFLIGMALLARWTVAPIRPLVAGTERIASGDLDTLVDVGRRKDEFHTLADSFNRMTGQLRRQRDQIVAHSRDMERKVGERTAELANANEQLNRANESLKELATTDELTGLWNRRQFTQIIHREVDRSRRTGARLALAMFDIDKFKSINDGCGHAMGDQVLREVATALRDGARSTDFAARYGGDEFMVLMPDTSAEEAASAAQRIRDQLDGRQISDGQRAIRVTVSAGLSAIEPGGLADADGLVRAADEALYAAKNSGRDCVRASGQEPVEAADEMSINRKAAEDLRARVVVLSRRSREMFVCGMRGLVQAQEARDPYAKFHSENVAHYAACIAQTMGLDDGQVAVIRRAGLLHDIGKIGVPDGILWKPGSLTEHERTLVQQHVLVGLRILGEQRFLEREVLLVRHHHERYDGHGYPDGISGEAIPLGARILCVADAFDAITADRSYRQARPVHEALQMMVAEAGRQFDSAVVDGLLQWVLTVSRSHGKIGTVTVSDLCEGRLQEIEAVDEVPAPQGTVPGREEPEPAN